MSSLTKGEVAVAWAIFLPFHVVLAHVFFHAVELEEIVRSLKNPFPWLCAAAWIWFYRRAIEDARRSGDPTG